FRRLVQRNELSQFNSEPNAIKRRLWRWHVRKRPDATCGYKGRITWFFLVNFIVSSPVSLRFCLTDCFVFFVVNETERELSVAR
ncbi:hypothetical protein NDU88_003049, partial [Pleurodeles waltl]